MGFTSLKFHGMKKTTLSTRGTRRAALDDLLCQKKEQERRKVSQRRRQLTVIDDDSPASDDDSVEEEEEVKEHPYEKRRRNNRRTVVGNERRLSGEYFVKYVDRYHTGERYGGVSSSDLDDFIASSDDSESSGSPEYEKNEEKEKEKEREDVRMHTMEKKQGGVWMEEHVRKRQRKTLISSSSSDDDNDVPNSRTIENEKEQQQEEESEEEEECEIVVEPRMTSDKKIVVRKKNAREHHDEGPTLRERKGPDPLSPLERIRNAQKKAIEDGQEDSVRDPDESCSLLTDEGEPSSSNTCTSGAVSDDPSGEEQRMPAAPSRNDVIWRQEAEKLGINKMSEEEAFKAYIEYLFICSIDPQYEDQVKHSSSHRLLYTQAIRRIEYLIIQAQDYVHSESWRCCDTFLLESMERHVFIERVTPDEPCNHKGDEECLNTCAACGKGNGWIQVEFKCEKSTRNSFLAGKHDADIMLSQQYALASPIYQRNRRFVGTPRGDCEGVNESHCFFWLGNTCVKRISIFHALFHFRQHCVAFLRRAALRVLKASIERGETMSINDMMDIVLNDQNHSRMYTCFTSLLRVAESYQIAGGSEKDILGKRVPDCEPPQYALLSGKFTDIDVTELDTYLKDA